MPARGGLPAWEETPQEASPVPQLRTHLPQQPLMLLPPELPKVRKPHGEQEEELVVALSKIWTGTLVLLRVPEQDRVSTGDGEPLS